jgi:hypothetical protein
MDLHIKSGGTKQDVVQRITTHLINDSPESSLKGYIEDCVLAGMSKHSGSEGVGEGEPDSGQERLAAVRLARRLAR